MKALLFFLCVLVELATASIHAKEVQACVGAKINANSDVKIICSATWKFDGSCVGDDMWDKWTVTGRTNPTDAFVRPFEDIAITVIGFELVRLQNGHGDLNNRLSWFMIGSAITGQPDAMVWLAPGETRSRQMWPPGMGQAWPAKQAVNPSRLTDMIDLHGQCFGGGPISIFLTIYYTPN